MCLISAASAVPPASMDHICSGGSGSPQAAAHRKPRFRIGEQIREQHDRDAATMMILVLFRWAAAAGDAE